MKLMKYFSSRKLIVYFIIVFIVLASLLFFKSPDVNEVNTVINIPVENCYAQSKPCVVEFDDFKVTVSFEKNIYYLKKFDVSVRSENSDDSIIESIQIDFKMKNMNMGVNRFMLTKTNSKDKISYWKGKAILPVCVTGRADWVSELEVTTGNNKYILTFPLNVKRN